MNQELKPFTRKEQLEFLLEFLKAQKENIEKDIEEVKKEYELVLNK